MRCVGERMGDDRAAGAASNAEMERVLADERGDARWTQWGPYLSERQWATVREDYSAEGDAWRYFPHEHARSRAYRWGEDGLLGISDDKQNLCFAIALWNEADPILKERLFGLTGPEGNHGEDVKELYYYLDSTPTHSYLKGLYKYPQRAFPYAKLLEQNRRRGRDDPEFELVHTGAFDGESYFDVFVEYAKAAPDDILVLLTVENRGPLPAPIHVLPTLWFRNTWSWGRETKRPSLSALSARGRAIVASHHALGDYTLHVENDAEPLFTENETNTALLWGVANASPFVKDGFHARIVDGKVNAVNPARVGTKAAAHARLIVPASGSVRLRYRLVGASGKVTPPSRLGRSSERTPFSDFDAIMELRRAEADAYYASIQPASLTDDERSVHRQALAGMLWSKQFYHYVVGQWLEGDPANPPPPAARRRGRNREWSHVYNERVMSMPDKWEYPWYAAWDLAFHCVPLALVDPAFAKSQLDLLVREWYQHPNGQIPAYEWAFGDVNPPVYAWAAWRIYKIEKRMHGHADRAFLERVFHKLMINFTWWVNRKDAQGNNVFQGGFLGLDNIGVFDRSSALPTGGHLSQSDGTSWMGMFSLNMMTIAIELARQNAVYEDIATKFFEHFLSIAEAMSNLGGEGIPLWDEQDEFFYDVLHLPRGDNIRLKVRSLVGLVPLLAVETMEPVVLDELPGFRSRLEWYLNYRPDLARLVSRWSEPGRGDRRLLALVRGSRMKRLLRRMLDPAEFLSDYGVRSVSRYHRENPYVLHAGDSTFSVRYEPAESHSGLFGGNSNWRGPIWFPINYLLIEALQKFHHYYGDDFKVECPTHSGRFLTLAQIADELEGRLVSLFLRDERGKRPFHGANERLQGDPHFRDHLLFHEYFNGDTGEGLGASHQTGWTGLVAKLIDQRARTRHQ
jgi:hypothetical protein